MARLLGTTVVFVLATVALSRTPASPALVGIHKIRHVIVIMQENRSFDNYFGTFPGADGIPMHDGVPTVCDPDPATHLCVKPFVDHDDINGGGPHATVDSVADIDHGTMQGFIDEWLAAKKSGGCADIADPACVPATTKTPDVMSYHTESDIPNYWTYAKDFVLQDHMFEPVSSWSLPSHLYLVSEWSAYCTRQNDPMSCQNAAQSPGYPPDYAAIEGKPVTAPIYAWTDMTWLMFRAGVSWGYYVKAGIDPDCDNDAALTCVPQRWKTGGVIQSPVTPGIWNPLLWFDTVKQDRQTRDVQPTANFYTAAKAGRLPAVSWVMPSGAVSEHPPSPISAGQSYVTGIINAVMKSPDWSSSAIFLSWDDWGGFYDNVVPPRADQNGFGMRVPGIVISPYAKRGYVDHQTMSFDAFNKFIEDDFLNAQRLNPNTDGRPDPRPDVRETLPDVGDLTKDFNFNQAPWPPVLLPVNPKTTLIHNEPVGPGGY